MLADHHIWINDFVDGTMDVWIYHALSVKTKSVADHFQGEPSSFNKLWYEKEYRGEVVESEQGQD